MGSFITTALDIPPYPFLGDLMIENQSSPIDKQNRALPLAFGKYRGWSLRAVAASDPNYCGWLLKQPFVRREFPALYRALEGLALPQKRVRIVRVERRVLSGCSVYTFPSERIVRRPPAQQYAGVMSDLFDQIAPALQVTAPDGTQMP